MIFGQQTLSKGVIWACKILIIWDLANSIFVIFLRGYAGLESMIWFSKLFFTLNYKFIV